ncbi:unnamed protein product [Lactuca saligna]|uniref:Uncharacterized protein n=1 Tax=Lactuca saligna TaxID=75948 RepID=A0AA35VJN3_LACSI|nr:unnamed protein product [Lactuca saligna]
MENMDAGEDFFGGLGPESGHTYVQTPPPIVDVEDNTATLIKGRIKMKSKFCKEPYTQVPPTTEPLKNRKGKKTQKENNVAKRQLLLNNYADCDDEFWKLWGKKMGAVFVEHRLLRGIDMNWEFWSTLLGIGSRWLLSQEISPSNCRWTIINPEGTTLEPGKQHYLRRIAAGMVDGPHWKDIDRVNDGSFKSLGDSILSELDHISYWAHFPNRQKPTEVKFVKGKHVPQQEQVEEGERGDC